MAAMLIHGVRPGPLSMIEPPQFVHDVITMMLFAIAARLFDVWVMLGFGIAGFALRRGLVLSDGEVTPFFTRPISAVVCALIVLIVPARMPAIQRLALRRPS